MKDLRKVRQLYNDVDDLHHFDFEALASNFEGYNIFGLHQLVPCRLPFFGEIQLGIVALENKLPLELAKNDGQYDYRSQVVFVAPLTAALAQGGYEAEKYGPLAGLVVLSCHQSHHSRLFGHPASYFGGGKWPKRTPPEFITKLLPNLIKNAVSRYYPAELHEFPFEEDQKVKVFMKDTTKIGGYTRPATGKTAMAIASEMASEIINEARGNANVCGEISARNVRFILPAFGKNHIGR